MKTTIEGNTALTEVPYEANEYHEAGVRIHEWIRTPVQKHKLGFEVVVYVEGYRPMKDVWAYDTFPFDSLADALVFEEKVNMASSDEKELMLEFKKYDEYGWYGMTVEYFEVFEYTAGGKFQWKRVR